MKKSSFPVWKGSISNNVLLNSKNYNVVSISTEEFHIIK